MTNDQREPFCQVAFNSNCSDGDDIAVIDITTLFRDQAKPTDISSEKSKKNDLKIEIPANNFIQGISDTPLRKAKDSSAADLENKIDSSSITRRSA